MSTVNLHDTVTELTSQASESGAGRAARTLYGGHEKSLRHTVIVLNSDTALAEHESPGDATVLVLSGRVRLAGQTESWEGGTGDLLPIPPERHSLTALEDAVVLLSVAKVV